jgi:glyoxylase-like metal-dependent hydrolase (beta-lactamase superfamily II)
VVSRHDPEELRMAYTGHVEPDGDWQDRDDGAVRIRKLSVESFDNNVYVVSCRRTDRSLLIDVAARPERLREALAGTSPIAAVQTHGHWDHVRAWTALMDDPGLEVWGHPGDAELFPAALDRELAHGAVLAVGDVEVEVLHVPGHTDGSLLYLVRGEERPHLFSGDTLFPGGHGKTATAADHDRIMDGLEERVFGPLPDETWVYPGHGDDTTLGTERPHLDEWRQRGW